MPGDTVVTAEKPVRIIDAQVHMWERDRPHRPWDHEIAPTLGPSGARHYEWCKTHEMTPDDMIQAMSAAGVAAAIAVSPFLIYGYDPSLAFEAAERHANFFRVVSPFQPDLPDLEDQLDAWRARPGAAGIRIVGRAARAIPLTDEHYTRLLRAAEQRDIPVCVYRPGAAHEIAELARRHPGLQLVIDHLGLAGHGDGTWSGLSAILTLATWPNIAIKATGVVAHSRNSYPFADVWPPLRRVLDAFGTDRVLWGSDWTRVENATYSEGVNYVLNPGELSESELGQLMGGNTARIFHWPAEPPA